MIVLLAFILFFGVIASTWWMGLWSNLISLISFLLAAMLASSFFEPIASRFEDYLPSYTYVSDFICVWAIFIFSFLILRIVTDFLSKVRLRFDTATEMVGRSILSIWLAGCFVCFSFFTLHMAPLPPNAFQVNVQDRVLGIGPDRQWLAFIQSRSRGALSEVQDSKVLDPYNLSDHPDDVDQNKRVFDPTANFIFNFHLRRQNLSKTTGIRVAR